MQIDSIPRFNMDFESDATFISNANNNNRFAAKYNRNNTNNNNYSSSTITPNNNNNTNTNTTNNNKNNDSNNNQPLEWSTMSFSYPKNGTKKKGSIELPINFKYTPTPSSHQPFQYQSPTQVPFTWSAVNKQLISQLFKLESYFEGKTVLELGSGFGIPSIISLYLGAKHTYLTDGNNDILAILPIIFNKNNISSNKYTVQKLLYNNFNFKTNKNIDIILAAHVLDTKQNANSFYETISYFFDNFVQEQRLKFIKKKQKEYENKQYCTPNVRHQFNKIGDLCKHRQDLNKPITNGGYLPYSLKPAQIMNHKHSNTNTKTVDDISTNTNASNTTNTNSILSRSDDDISTNSLHTNTELPNTITTPMYNETEYKYKYKTPFFNPGISSLSAITTIADIQPLVISRFSQFEYDQFNQTNKQNKGNKSCIPKLAMFNEYESDDDDEDDDDDGDANMDRLKEIKIDKKEENEFLSKSKVNAPILIIAIHKSHRNKDIKLRDNVWNTFHNKCIQKGYRIQNVLFEWDFEIWVVKA